MEQIKNQFFFLIIELDQTIVTNSYIPFSKNPSREMKWRGIEDPLKVFDKMPGCTGLLSSLIL